LNSDYETISSELSLKVNDNEINETHQSVLTGEMSLNGKYTNFNECKSQLINVSENEIIETKPEMTLCGTADVDLTCPASNTGGWSDQIRRVPDNDQDCQSNNDNLMSNSYSVISSMSLEC